MIARFLVDEGVLTRFQAENLLAGRTTGFVLGQYRILDDVGRGGMGRVFKAEHATMRRVVALKVLAAHLTRTERARQLFQREVRAAARLVHPHIVRTFEYGLSTKGGAPGVGRSVNATVVASAAGIFVLDYLLSFALS